MAWIALLPKAVSHLASPRKQVTPLTEISNEQQDICEVANAASDVALWALQFTPHVTCISESLHEHSFEAVLMEVGGSLRLWGGLRRLLTVLRTEGKEVGVAHLSTGSTGLVALARLYLRDAEHTVKRIEDLPLYTLAAAWPHLVTLQQMGCVTWGELNALPRGGITRRFGAQLLGALDMAHGRRPETYTWLSLPEVFSVKHELQANVENAEGLLFTASRQLKLMEAWLRARHQGVIACKFIWHLDARRNTLPSGDLVLRTARPTQDMKHLERLLSEHLHHTELPAPAHTLTLQTLHCEALPQITHSLLPEDEVNGEPLHYFIERVLSKLGQDAICVPVLREDHRPEATQSWVSAALPASLATKHQHASALFRPAWLMAKPLRLVVRDDRPYYQGVLKLVHGPERVESSQLADIQLSSEGEPEPASRDYFIAWNTHAGLLWVFRERLVSVPGWYLHGLFG